MSGQSTGWLNKKNLKKISVKRATGKEEKIFPDFWK
jgi:hypothetical protein